MLGVSAFLKYFISLRIVTTEFLNSVFFFSCLQFAHGNLIGERSTTLCLRYSKRCMVKKKLEITKDQISDALYFIYFLENLLNVSAETRKWKCYAQQMKLQQAQIASNLLDARYFVCKTGICKSWKCIISNDLHASCNTLPITVKI